MTVDSIIGIGCGVTSQYLVCPPWALTTDTHLLYMEWISWLIMATVIAVHILRKIYTQICCSYWPWSYFIEFSLDFIPQVLYWIPIRTEGRPWHDSDVVLLEKVPGGSISVGVGIVLLEHVMLAMAKIGHIVTSKDLIDIPRSRDAITSTWANILKDNRSSFMTDPDGSPNHDALPIPWCFAHPTSLSSSHMHLRKIRLFFTRPVLCHQPSKYRTNCHLKRRLLLC